MTEQTKQLLKRINGNAGWAMFAVAAGALLWNVLTGTWGAASASGAQGQKLKEVASDVESLETQYKAIRSDLSEIKIQIGQLTTKLESGDDDS